MSASGYAVIPVWLLRDESLDTTAKMLYVHLSSYVGRDNTCWPSQASLAEHLGCDVRTVRRAVAELRDAGVISVEVRTTKAGRGNVYTLLSDRFGGVRTQPSEERGGEDTGVLTGEDTSVVRTRTIGTRPEDNMIPNGDVTLSEAPGRVDRTEPETHPSRPITPHWAPRGSFVRHLGLEYADVNLRESCTRFVNHHIARGDTSRSWEAMFQNWVSSDQDRHDQTQREGTDDLGMPLTQRKRTEATATPEEQAAYEAEVQAGIDETLRLDRERQEAKRREEA